MKWRIEFQLFKIEAHQDDLKEFNKLTWEEKLNVWCDLRAKYLIQTEEKSLVPWPFHLQSLFVKTKEDRVILNEREDIVNYVGIKQSL